jgi:chemotaxis methyl-accepting protein methylase
MRRLLDRFGFSWAGYRRVRKGVKKRLTRHLQETGCSNIGDYIKAIESDREVRLRFECLMTDSTSRFFRDRALWQNIQDRILPLLAKATRHVMVWSAGCASGEEVYSFKMLWEDMQESRAGLPHLSILATDLCPDYLERARAAVYPPSSLKEVPEAMRSAYFETSGEAEYAVKSWIKTGISWQVHDLLSDPPGAAFDLIFMRNNLLTYYRDEVRIPALMKASDRLAPRGFLIIGSHERLPVEPEGVKPYKDTPCVFQKQV